MKIKLKPYMMRAVHEWCSDQRLTPYMVVVVAGKMQVPMEFVEDGQIVLNVAYGAVRNLHIGDDYVRFSARFNGVSRDIIVPVDAVASLYARETGEGMAWETDAVAAPTVTTSQPKAIDASSTHAASKSNPASRAHLRVVK